MVVAVVAETDAEVTTQFLPAGHRYNTTTPQYHWVLEGLNCRFRRRSIWHLRGRILEGFWKGPEGLDKRRRRLDRYRMCPNAPNQDLKLLVASASERAYFGCKCLILNLMPPKDSNPYMLIQSQHPAILPRSCVFHSLPVISLLFRLIRHILSRRRRCVT